MILGSTLFYLGELVSAREHLEQGIAFYDPEHSLSRAFRRGADPSVICLSGLAWTLWTLGYPNQALTRNHQALTLAQQLSHAYSLGYAMHFAATLHKWLREVQLVQEHSEAAMALSGEHGFARWLAGGMIKGGWSLAEQGATEKGIEQLRQGLAMWQAKAGELGLPNNLAMLAEAYGKGGNVEEGLHVLAEALGAVHKNAEHHYEAELYRLKGELLLQQASARGNTHTPLTETSLAVSTGLNTSLEQTGAEDCFRQALGIARQQGAKSLELRAAMSLSRLWQQQGKRAEAHQMLVGIYGWFTEGFDTLDLQEAKTLLETLLMNNDA